jgi:hypothetical protein
MGEVGVDFGLAHLCRMPFVMEKYEPFDPVAIALLSSSAVMAGAKCFA